MDLGKFVKELFHGNPSAGGTGQAPKPTHDKDTIKQTATTESTPEKPAPQRLPRMNTQEMRRLLSQIDFDGSVGLDSQSPEENSAPEQDAGRQYLERLSQQHQTPHIRGFWDDDFANMEGDLSSLEKHNAIEELERELDKVVTKTPIACKRLSDSQGPSTFNGQPHDLVKSSVEPAPFIFFQIAGSRKELKASEQALKKAEALLSGEAEGPKDEETPTGIEHGPQSRNEGLGTNRHNATSRRDSRGGWTLTQDELAALDAPAPPLVFASAGVFFGKASDKGAAPLAVDEQALQKARLMFEPSPEKTAEVKPAATNLNHMEGFSEGRGWSTAGFGGGFMNFKGNLQLTEEAMAKAKKLFESDEKEAASSGGQDNSLKAASLSSFGFGKASTWGNTSMGSNLMLTDEAMEKARKLLDDDAYPEAPEANTTTLLNKPKGLHKERQEGAGNVERIEAKSKGGFSSSSNPSKSLKSTLGLPKRSGAFVAPKQIRPLTDAMIPKNPRFPIPKGAFRDPAPLTGLSRDNQLRLVRPRTSAFTNKLQINFEKYKNMSLTLAKRFKNKSVCPNLQRIKPSKCPGSYFITPDEIYQLCEPFLRLLSIKSSEELVRELTAELRLQADKFDQHEEYVSHHLHMLSRKYVGELQQASKGSVNTGGGVQSTASAQKPFISIFSDIMTDLYCRYRREEFLGSKSPLRLLREGSINQERRVCLMVKSIRETPSDFMLELTDGWYIVYYRVAASPTLVATIKDSARTKPKIDSSNDDLILRLILLQKIQVGTKLEVSNLGISVVAPEKLDEYKVWEPVECKLHYNSLKRCMNQRTKLGLIYSFPKPTRLGNIYPHGGPVPLLDVLIVAKKGIKVFGGSGVEYLTMSDHQLSEEPPSVSFALVVIDTLHVSTDYATKSVVYHELQVRYQSLPAYLSYEVGQRLELSNYRIARKLGTPLVMNFRQQYERGFLLQEQKKNCIQPKELPKDFKKTLPMYKLLLESRISQRLTLEELAMTHLVPEAAKPKSVFAFLSIGANYITHGKQEALFHVYKTHFIQVRYQSFDDYKLAQAQKAAAKDPGITRDGKADGSCTTLPNPAVLDAEKQAFWKRFIHKTTTNDRSRLASDPDERSRGLGPTNWDDTHGGDNSYANLVPPPPKPQVQPEPREQQEEQTVAIVPETRVADPLVVFFDLIFTGSVNTIEISKKTKVYIHQCSFEPPGSFVLGSNFIAEFCESDSFEKYLLSQYQQGVQVANKEVEGGLKPLLARMQRYVLG